MTRSIPQTLTHHQDLDDNSAYTSGFENKQLIHTRSLGTRLTSPLPVQQTADIGMDENAPLPLESCRQVALEALALSVKDWNELSQETEPLPNEKDALLDMYVERITALFLIRIVAVASLRKDSETLTLKQVDLSTSGLCRKTLIEEEPWWSDAITTKVVQQIRQLVRFILDRYNNKLPYHNFQHAYIVVVAANKLLDLMLAVDSGDYLDDRPPPSFGLRYNPAALMSLIMAALIHDVDHKGVSNRQLASEEHPLALRYNDKSVNEQQSLHVFFDHFLLDDYAQLRAAMFSGGDEEEADVDYRYFRATVVNTVLATDIACPERTQISKSKWKEGFAAVSSNQFVEEAEVVRGGSGPRNNASSSKPAGTTTRRGSNMSMDSCVSDVTMDSYALYMRQQHRLLVGAPATTQQRKLSMGSMADSVPMMQRKQYQNGLYSNDREESDSLSSEPSSLMMDDSLIHKVEAKRSNGIGANVAISGESMTSKKSAMLGHHKEPPVSRSSRKSSQRARRRNSTQSYDTYGSSSFESYAAESVGLTHRRQAGKPPTRKLNRTRSPMLSAFQPLVDDSSSLSLTPPSSDDEQDRKTTKVTPRITSSRRASTGNVPMRFGSVAEHRIDEDHVDNISLSSLRLSKSVDADDATSSNNNNNNRFRKRLGIRRSIDFSGESIDVYSRRSSMGSMAMDGADMFPDEPDELKASVVLELIMRAADVAHVLQNWESMSKWSSLLFQELVTAHKAGRGPNPAPGWFENQSMALESYVMPLALQLDETGVFGEFTGAVFSQSVEHNRDKWSIYGFDLTSTLRKNAGL